MRLAFFSSALGVPLCVLREAQQCVAVAIVGRCTPHVDMPYIYIRLCKQTFFQIFLGHVLNVHIFTATKGIKPVDSLRSFRLRFFTSCVCSIVCATLQTTDMHQLAQQEVVLSTGMFLFSFCTSPLNEKQPLWCGEHSLNMFYFLVLTEKHSAYTLSPCGATGTHMGCCTPSPISKHKLLF